MLRRIWLPALAALVAGLGIVGPPPTTALADEGGVAPRAVDVYTTPGYHDVNGRKWHTTCEKYSSTVERCRAEIWATQVSRAGSGYKEVTGWFFNNLTYKPSPREQWAGNPLGFTGNWTTSAGRRWRTECDTAISGGNGCRSYIWSKDIGVKTLTPRTYEDVERWVFNNVVQFTIPKPKPTPPPKPVPKVWCDNAPLPSNMKLRQDNGLPYSTKAPYTPQDIYNPTSISNFIVNVEKDTRLNATQRSCLANLAANHLIDGSHVEKYQGNDVRWFGYRFDFSASPSVPKLSGKGDGWFSGLAQGGALSAFITMKRITGDAKWMNYGRQVFRSFDVPMKPDGTGGITNRIPVKGKQVLWFEEYPTSPATSVLNGHLEALIGLDIWFKETGDQHAKDLINEALDGLEPALEQIQTPVQGGMLTSYDLIRGYFEDARDYKSSPIRITSTTAMKTPKAQLNGKDLNVPLVVNPPGAKANKIVDPGMEGPNGTWSPNWPHLAGKNSNVKMIGGVIVAETDGRQWQGVSQVIPGNTFAQGKRLALSLDAKLETPPNGGRGASGKVAIYEQCPGGTTKLLFETQKMRSSTMTGYTMSFTPTYAGCPMLLQLLTSTYGYAGTKISYDNVTLREEDDPAPSIEIAPKNTQQFDWVDQFVYNQPVSELKITGNDRGPVTVQAWEDGRWQLISSTVLQPGVPYTVKIPERITGRNMHYGYHENHVEELVSLYNRTVRDNPKDREFLRQYAASWVRMAPSKVGMVPPPPKPNARMASAPDPGARYELETFDPFALLEEE